MIRNSKETFPPKTGMRKARTVARSRVRDACCSLQGCRGIFVVVVRDVRDGSNYIVYHNSNYLNWEILQINASNNNLFRIKTLY